MTSSLRGIALGLLAVALLFAASLVAVLQNVPGGALLQYISLVVGGFVAARVSANHKLLISAALALPAIVVVALLTWAWIAAGFPADDVGFEGAVIFGIHALPMAAALCLLGGGLGAAVDRWMTPDKSPERTRER